MTNPVYTLGLMMISSMLIAHLFGGLTGILIGIPVGLGIGIWVNHILNPFKNDVERVLDSLKDSEEMKKLYLRMFGGFCLSLVCAIFIVQTIPLQPLSSWLAISTFYLMFFAMRDAA